VVQQLQDQIQKAQQPSSGLPPHAAPWPPASGPASGSAGAAVGATAITGG